MYFPLQYFLLYNLRDRCPKLELKSALICLQEIKNMACMSIATQRRGKEIRLYRNKVYVCY